MKKGILLLASLLFVFTAYSQNYVLKSVPPAEFNEGINKKGVVILDVRTPAEFNAGHIKNAINIDFYNPSFYANLDKQLDKSKPIYIYCRSGNRSMQAARAMVQRGYKVVIDLKGGKNFWLAQGFKFVKS